MKSLKRILALLICLGILCAFFPQVLATGGETPESLPSWSNGNLTEHVAGGDANYYGAETPFGYAFYYEGTDPADSRSAGFHDMVLSDNGGANTWTNGRYFCGLNAGETENCNRVNAIHLAASNAPNYHYSPGVVFTAPQAGTVEFTYQYAGLDNTPAQHTFYVMRDSASGYGDALYSYKPAKVVHSNGTGGEYDTAVMQITVAAGEKIYFITDNTANGSMSTHWISSAKYLAPEVTYTLATDKETYTAGTDIVTTATLSSGSFGAEDYIAIVAEGQTEPTAKMAAAASVTFTGGVAAAGKYTVALVVGGKTVASADIQVNAAPVSIQTEWNNGNLTEHIASNNFSYYSSGTPFGYAFFYEGTDPADSRAKGFHPMVLSSNSGANTWCDGSYFCGLNASESASSNRVNAIHRAAANAPNYHYSPGVVFTAPQAGTVEFTYQYAGYDGTSSQHTFYVMRETATGYGDALYSYKPTKVVRSNGSGGVYDTAVMQITVAAGEKIYFITDNTGNGYMSAHWISSAKYLIPEATYSLTTDKAMYRSNENITVTTTVANTTLGAEDYIAIFAKGASESTVQKAAAETVTFDSTLKAGEYTAELYVKGKAAPVAKETFRVADEPRSDAATWSNGDLINKTFWKGEKDYLDDAPFGYAYWYQGTDPSDSRAAGFYDMVLANNGGANTWCNGRYFCAATTSETAASNRVNAIHLAAVTYPTYHYSTGFVFTAPYTGTVEFTYQFACTDSAKAGHFYVLRDSATGYSDAIQSFSTDKVAFPGKTDGSARDEATFTIDLTKGEKLFFIVDTDAGTAAYSHWISSAKYLTAAQLNAPDSAVYDRTATSDGLADGTLTITSTGVITPDSYIAYWADKDGALADYTAFPLIVSKGKTTVYTLPAGSMIPTEADRILVYAKAGSSLSATAATAMLPEGCNNYHFGTPSYEMQVVSDVHINAKNPGKHSAHFTALLEQVKKLSPDSIGLFINGDTADTGARADWELFHQLIDEAGAGLPTIYNSIGNHDLYSGDYQLFLEQTVPCTDKPYTDLWLNGTHFIFMGSEINDLNAQLSDEQLAWLEETLAEDRDMNRPIYLFLHQGISGTVAGTSTPDDFHAIAQNDEFCEILKDYPEVVLFSSHSHADMNLVPAYQARSENLPSILNTAAVAYLNNEDWSANVDGSQAYFLYAYADKLVIKGRDLVADKWLAANTFCIDFSNVTIPSRTEMDTDKTMYKQGEAVTVTATLASGSFGADDYIAILPVGSTAPAAKKAAAATVTFTEALTAGEYQVVLKLDGTEGYALVKTIRVAEAPLASESAWDNGNISTHLGGGEKRYYDADTPFGYAFFYQGTDPADSREKGFHDMILASNDGAYPWCDGRYFCGLNASETENCNRVNSIHLAASVAPSWHYSPGFVFTAPYTGTVRFVYQIAHLDSFANQHQFYVMRADAADYRDALKAYKAQPTSIVSSGNGSGRYDTITLTVDVTRGEKLYFVVDNRSNGSMSAHWIQSAEYLTTAEISYGVSTGKASYTVGDEITVSATVSGATFAAEDYIAIVAEGQTDPIAKKAAAASVSFTDIPVGSYQVLLVVGGKTVASAKVHVEKEMTAADATWDNGAITAHVGAAGEKNYIQAPFGYAFFYEGTDPDDPRSAGFHDMVLSSNGGANTWTNGRYFCAANADETQNCNRVNAIHLAAANAPNYHYSPGFVFTAPFTGTVEFTYQYAGLDSLNDAHTFYVMRDSALGYGDAVKSYKQTEVLANEGAGSFGEDTFTLEVTAGEKIYFVTDNTGNAGMGVHWIKSAKYLIGNATYTLSTDKELYDLGEKVTVSATVSTGTFGENDYIAIIADGEQTPHLKLAAAESIVFEPTAKELPAGKYQVVLVLNGQDAYLSGKANFVACCEILVRDAIDPNNAAWNNNTLLSRLGANGENAYYRSGSPFGYAFFYEGTDPDDSRARGFHDMILSSNGGANAWTNGRYFCGLNAGETQNCNRVNAIHLAASNAPNYHYSPGMVFTAPYTGTVKLTYQFGGLDTIDANHTFYVMRDSAGGYDDALYSFKATKTVYSNGTGWEYNEQVLTIDVTKGEKIYFVVDNTANGGMSAHWISTVQYLDASGNPISPLPSPDTGDDSALGLWLAALVLSVSGLGAVYIANGKRRRKSCAER